MGILKNFWSVECLAQELRLHSNTVRKYVNNGKLDAVLLGGQYWIPQVSVDRYIEEQTGKLCQCGRRKNIAEESTGKK